MTKTRSVSFMKTFYSYPEAEDYAEKLAVPSIVVFLVGTDGHNLFTVCAQEHIDAVQEELNAIVKELAAPEKIEWKTTLDCTWVMRITADRKIEVNKDVEVTEAAKAVLASMQEMLEKNKREWIGLTDEEAAECWSTSAVFTWQAIEAKLKEKNT
jgi:hypothetical protein